MTLALIAPALLLLAACGDEVVRTEAGQSVSAPPTTVSAPPTTVPAPPTTADDGPDHDDSDEQDAVDSRAKCTLADTNISPVSSRESVDLGSAPSRQDILAEELPFQFMITNVSDEPCHIDEVQTWTLASDDSVVSRVGSTGSCKVMDCNRLAPGASMTFGNTWLPLDDFRQVSDDEDEWVPLGAGEYRVVLALPSPIDFAPQTDAPIRIEVSR